MPEPPRAVDVLEPLAVRSGSQSERPRLLVTATLPQREPAPDCSSQVRKSVAIQPSVENILPPAAAAPAKKMRSRVGSGLRQDRAQGGPLSATPFRQPDNS